ncbi:putative ABC transport system permease protein [Alteromonadaceae bacterium Bs31]|nr:putative ABC transport system permease protein [Alteromonadaceae bacterium Bs31]
MYILDRDIWQEIFDSVARHKLRAVLTAFGVFWGIFMLVNLLAAGKGLENGANASMGSLKNAIYLWSGRPTSIPYKGLTKGRYIRMNDDDMAAILRLNEVDLLAPANGMGDQYVSHGVQGDTFRISGNWPVFFTAKDYRLSEGRFINALDLKEERKNVVIGETVREILFGENATAVGKQIKILGVQFQIVGVVRPSALNDWAQNDLRRVFLPHSTIRKTFNQGDRVHSMMITPKPGIDANLAEDKVISLLKSRHRIHPDDVGVIGSWNAQESYQNVQGLFKGIAAFSWFVAIGTIIAGVVGVGNIMLISVKERTKEIGIRKAIGATPGSIVGAILQESLVITFVAGYLGLVAGVFTIELVARFTPEASKTFMNPEVSFSTAMWAIVVLLLAGAFASILPAKKAAGVNPVIALQDE